MSSIIFSARQRLQPWANLSRLQSDEETYGLRIDDLAVGVGSASAAAGGRGPVAACGCAERRRAVEMSSSEQPK